MPFCELEKERGSQAPNSAFSVTIPRACEMPVGNTECACNCSAAVGQGMVIIRNDRTSIMIYNCFYVCLLKNSQEDMLLCYVKGCVLPVLQRIRKCLGIADIPQ